VQVSDTLLNLSLLEAEQILCRSASKSLECHCGLYTGGISNNIMASSVLPTLV